MFCQDKKRRIRAEGEKEAFTKESEIEGDGRAELTEEEEKKKKNRGNEKKENVGIFEQLSFPRRREIKEMKPRD